MTGICTGTSPDILRASQYRGQGPRRPTWASYYRGLEVPAATNPGVQSIRVELRGVWLSPRGDNAPLCNHPNQPANPPTPLKSPPRKSWVAINQSTKYQCSATNKQNENTNQLHSNRCPRAWGVGNSWVISLILIDVTNCGCKKPDQEFCVSELNCSFGPL